MNFLQRIGNALSRFMYGRNGVDKLGLTMLWAAILLNLILPQHSETGAMESAKD